MNQNDKHSQICSISFLWLSEAEIEHWPGSNNIKIKGEWKNLLVSSGEFTEKLETVGGVIKQELKAVITDTGASNKHIIINITGIEGIIMLEFTNGDRKLIGTDQFPAILSYEYSGSPLTLTLKCKRDSPEPAATLASF